MTDGGYGPVRRKEDARFIRGKGTFVDDIQLPGMLHGAILRSPLAHARIVSIDTTAAEGHPKVNAVITGQMLEDRKLAWMPTLSRDIQAGLATDKVRFAGPEGAGHQCGAVPGPGGPLCGRRGPVLGPRRARAHQRRVRAAPRGDRRHEGAGPRCPGDPG